MYNSVSVSSPAADLQTEACLRLDVCVNVNITVFIFTPETLQLFITFKCKIKYRPHDNQILKSNKQTIKQTAVYAVRSSFMDKELFKNFFKVFKSWSFTSVS